MMATKSNEFDIIRKITRDSNYFSKKNIIGPGDDCAVFGDNYLITTDTLLEDHHFKLNYSSYYDIGWKSLAVSLSDIAAMGGKPEVATIAVQFSENNNIEECYRGIYDLADRYHVEIVGGDTVRSEKFGITSTVIGKSIIKPILRSGAKAEDDIWLTNKIGLAQLGLDSFENTKYQEFQKYHQRPEPRLEISASIANYANSMIDISDGLFQDLSHICKMSQLDAFVDLSIIPSVITYCDDARLFLKLCTSGDDYELIFTSPKVNREYFEKNSALTRIGRMKKINNKPEIYADSKLLTDILKQYGIERMGYSHF